MRLADDRETSAQERTQMKFGAYYPPTYIPALEWPASEFYPRKFEQRR